MYNRKDEIIISLLENISNSLSDIRYEMENYTPDRGFFVESLEGYQSSIDQYLQELGKYFEKENNDV